MVFRTRQSTPDPAEGKGIVCALCKQPFRSDPHDDVNEFYSHYSKDAAVFYCTPCFMQLFFDGDIDLGSDDPETIYKQIYIGHSEAPYSSRLADKGYQMFATVEEMYEGDDVSGEFKEICRQIINKGRRYLILGVEDPESSRYRFIIYQST